MPVGCASIRSMARCVLPVLVGPRTAVTPRARASRDSERLDVGRSSASMVGGSFEREGRRGAVAARAGRRVRPAGRVGDVRAGTVLPHMGCRRRQVQSAA
ncbi:hypothetical protein SB3_05050 [Methylobacterium radiotolerans]|nr:hypothetical protein SB3_05050 [Methylobacterium radiotolerans]